MLVLPEQNGVYIVVGSIRLELVLGNVTVSAMTFSALAGGMGMVSANTTAHWETNG